MYHHHAQRQSPDLDPARKASQPPAAAAAATTAAGGGESHLHHSSFSTFILPSPSIPVSPGGRRIFHKDVPTKCHCSVIIAKRMTVPFIQTYRHTDIETYRNIDIHARDQDAWNPSFTPPLYSDHFVPLPKILLRICPPK
jgi:hypothetical protein